jgi:hypothetical protein
LLEGLIDDRILFPVAIIEVPPLVLVDRESLGFHGRTQDLAVPPLERRSPRIPRIRSCGKLVVAADHRDRLSRRELVQREIDGGATIVLGALARIGDEVST